LRCIDGQSGGGEKLGQPMLKFGGSRGHVSPHHHQRGCPVRGSP
jgi:hypothetical protein